MTTEQANPNQASSRPSWHFPPTGGGIEVIQESATTNFRESPLDKFVREVLQNSTDAHDHNAGPVEVAFREAFYPSELFGAEVLIEHTEAAWFAASEENQPKLADQYQNAAETLRMPTIRCLNIADRNTTGLSGYKWDALLTKAGAIRKDQTTAGGRFGIGKNAVFNVSTAKTAFYYTCFQDGTGRKRHRVEKWMGKSVLTAHTIGEETLQHIGFYRHIDGTAYIRFSGPGAVSHENSTRPAQHSPQWNHHHGPWFRAAERRLAARNRQVGRGELLLRHPQRPARGHGR